MTSLVLKIVVFLFVSKCPPSTEAFGFGFNVGIKLPFFSGFFGSGTNNNGQKAPDSKEFNAAFDAQKMPMTPSEFWGWALRKKYGYKTHFIPGVVPKAAFSSDGAAPSGPFVGAIKVTYGASASANSSQVQIATKVLNYAYFNLDLSIIFEFDAQRESKLEGRMYSLDPQRAIQNFTKGMVPSNFDSVRAAYKRDPEKFIDDYLDLFYPAAIEGSFNVKIQPNQWNKLSSKLLVSKSPVILVNEKMERSEKSYEFSLRNNVQIVEYDSSKVAFTMSRFNTIMMHGKGSEILCEEYDASKSFVTYIKEVFEKYGSKNSKVLSFITEYVEITTIDWSLNYKLAYGTSTNKFQDTTNQNSLSGGGSATGGGSSQNSKIVKTQKVVITNNVGNSGQATSGSSKQTNSFNTTNSQMRIKSNSNPSDQPAPEDSEVIDEAAPAPKGDQQDGPAENGNDWEGDGGGTVESESEANGGSESDGTVTTHRKVTIHKTRIVNTTRVTNGGYYMDLPDENADGSESQGQTSVHKYVFTTGGNSNQANYGSQWGNSGGSANYGTHTKITVIKHTKIMQNGGDSSGGDGESNADADADSDAASTGDAGVTKTTNGQSTSTGNAGGSITLGSQKTNDIKTSSTGTSSPPTKAPVAPPKPKPIVPTKPTTTTTPKPFKSDTFAV